LVCKLKAGQFYWCFSDFCGCFKHISAKICSFHILNGDKNLLN